MTKADDKRNEIVDRLADFLIAQGPGAASLRAMAAAARTSDRMLLYYFSDKDAIIAATLQRAAEQLTVTLAAAASTGRVAPAVLEAEMLALVPRTDLWPYLAMWIEVAALAARGDALFYRVGRDIALGFLAWIGSRLDIDDGPARDAAALRVMRSIEGAIHLRAVGLP